MTTGSGIIGLSPGTDSPLVTRGDVEKQMLAHVQDWLVPYLGRVERHNQLTEHLAVPRSWEVVNEYTRYPEEQMPFIAVISPGINPGRKPRQDGDGWITAWWVLAVGAIVATRDERSAKDLAGYYGAAIRGLVMEMPMLGGWASGVEWEDEKYDDFPRVTERTMAAVRLVFTVEVQGVMNVYGAPFDTHGNLAPPSDPYQAPPDFPVVESAEATAEPQP
jgi:hypothetical protein